MKKLVLIIALMGSQVSFGTTRVDLQSLTTNEATQLLKDRGAVIFNTGKYTFERVVRNRSYCELDEVTRFFRGQTADENSAIVGRLCVQPNR